MAFSKWMMNHGTSAKVQDLDSVFYLGYYGWGLQFSLKKTDSSVWVHIPVPSVALLTLSQTIQLNYNVGLDVEISHVHVWNGGKQVHKFTDVKLQKLTGAHKQLKLPKPESFGEGGMGLSLLVHARSNFDSDRDTRKFILYGAGALFED